MMTTQDAHLQIFGCIINSLASIVSEEVLFGSFPREESVSTRFNNFAEMRASAMSLAQTLLTAKR
jgi:hypothetical protein